jgi:multisubunit Na+/H+ antiporter MnhB subunit
MGIVGLVVSLVFVGLSAPDLALTQLLVEGVTLLLMMLALRYLPAQSGTTPERDARKLRDAALSAVTGLGLGAIAWAVMMRPFETRSAHYLERALPEAGGSNVVNVVIVDFRGFDTFGETMVMAAAGLVIHALLAGRTLHAVSGPSRLQAVSAQTQRPLLLAVLAWAVLPFALMVSVYFFLRGHNLPGGGFIAGLVTSIGLLLQQMAQGAHHTPDVSDSSDASARSVRDPASHAIRRWHQCIGAGLLLAALDRYAVSFANEVFMVLTLAGPPVAPDNPHVLGREALLLAALEAHERKPAAFARGEQSRMPATYVGKGRVLLETAFGHLMLVSGGDTAIVPHLIRDGFFDRNLTNIIDSLLVTGIELRHSEFSTE